LSGHVLERSPRQQESLQEGQVFLAQVLDTRLSHVPEPFIISIVKLILLI
jgi:hypothetical protein